MAMNITVMKQPFIDSFRCLLYIYRIHKYWHWHYAATYTFSEVYTSCQRVFIRSENNFYCFQLLLFNTPTTWMDLILTQFCDVI